MGLLCWERSRRGSLLLRPGQKEGWGCFGGVFYRNLALALWLLFSHRLDFGISDCGFCTPIVRSNCPLKSIESAKFYENGFSPALPFMITLWPHDIRLCCIDFNTNNCWLRTEKNIKVQRKVKQLQSLIEKSESGVGWNACFANILLALKRAVFAADLLQFFAFV